jgi:uncharacterized protein
MKKRIGAKKQKNRKRPEMGAKRGGSVNERVEQLKGEMKKKGNILVALSGGVDSSVVAKIAYDCLGDKALAVVADSETLPRAELEEAKKVAREIGIPLKVISFSELDCKDFVENPPERCYYCRKELSRELKKIADSMNIETIADGVNSSDFGEHRPGIKAADEEGIWHPFVEFNFGKEEVRQLARLLELSVSDKPSMACMSSRIPYGEKITKEKLERVEKAEALLKELGFIQVRVRAHGDIARIEVPGDDIVRFLEIDTREIAEKFKELGFNYITLDLEGYRSGSMDEVL